MYVIYESPLAMMCDSPDVYQQEPEITSFIATIPTVWNESFPIDGRITKYAAVARRNGSEWYIGALTNWDARDLLLELSFLGEGQYRAEIFRDGVNAVRSPVDFKHEFIEIPADRNLTVHMAPGGGFIARLYSGSDPAPQPESNEPRDTRVLPWIIAFALATVLLVMLAMMFLYALGSCIRARRSEGLVTDPQEYVALPDPVCSTHSSPFFFAFCFFFV
jgi:hypothetical protein